MRYAFDAYRYVALSCAALVFFIIIQYLVSLVWSTHRLRADGKRAVERLWKLKREEPSEPEPAVSTEEPLSVSAEVQPILARQESSKPQPAMSTELPLQVGSKVRAVCKFGSVKEGTLGIITGVANVRFSWQSPAFLCTFADNMKVRARPKNIEAFNHEHSLKELEQPDFGSVLSQRMTLRAERLLSQQRQTRLPFAGRTETKLAKENKALGRRG